MQNLEGVRIIVLYNKMKYNGSDPEDMIEDCILPVIPIYLRTNKKQTE